MADIFDLQGRKLSTDPVIERVVPMIPMDTAEGHFNVPVVVLAQGQYDQLVKDVTKSIVDILCPAELEPAILAECPPNPPSD